MSSSEHDPWAEYTELEAAQQWYSDMYKDRNGVRPRPLEEEWNSLEWLKQKAKEITDGT